jgi:hypothetical protein
MIKDDINQGDKLIVAKGDFVGLKLYVRDTYMGGVNRNVKQIVLARQDNDLDFCRESEAEVKRLCERDS